jgi:carbamoyl-phosphate synthase small subunit
VDVAPRKRPEPWILALEDGSEFCGIGYGASTATAGEVVFNTGMTGYVEALTDPSYAGQILVLTYPLIGNYGVYPPEARLPEGGGYQSRRVQVQGLVVQHLSRHYSHHLATRSLEDWLSSEGRPILGGVDTRALTQRLRERGTMKGWLFPAAMTLQSAQSIAAVIDMRSDVFSMVSPPQRSVHGDGDPRLVLVDTGAKDGIIDCLVRRGAQVVRVPWHQDFTADAFEADGVIIGNGPGDPQDLDALVQRLRSLFNGYHGPVFGICLGHQLLARAAGFDTYKLRYGHRGINQPVRRLDDGRCYVTSQNHGFAVDQARCPQGWEPWFVNLNDGTNEGLRHLERPVRSVQFHPEGRPGPTDTEFLFDEFLALAGSLRAGRR